MLQMANSNLPYECSQILDKNSLRALGCDDEDGQYFSTSADFYNKQRQKSDTVKKFTPGSLCVVCGDLATGKLNICI